MIVPDAVIKGHVHQPVLYKGGHVGVGAGHHIDANGGILLRKGFQQRAHAAAGVDFASAHGQRAVDHGVLHHVGRHLLILFQNFLGVRQKAFALRGQGKLPAFLGQKRHAHFLFQQLHMFKQGRWGVLQAAGRLLIVQRLRKLDKRCQMLGIHPYPLLCCLWLIGAPVSIR